MHETHISLILLEQGPALKAVGIDSRLCVVLILHILRIETRVDLMFFALLVRARLSSVHLNRPLDVGPDKFRHLGDNIY